MIGGGGGKRREGPRYGWSPRLSVAVKELWKDWRGKDPFLKKDFPFHNGIDSYVSVWHTTKLSLTT